jgi:hypothetical protein
LTILRTILLIFICNAAFGQENASVKIVISTDQQVYITGEEIWLDAAILSGNPKPKYVQLQLVNRNGQVKADIKLLNREGVLSGLLEIPGDLVSDFYFIDASIPGMSTTVELAVVMVVNPKIPPAACSFSSVVLPAKSATQLLPVEINTDKTNYSKREQVTVTTANYADYSVVVKKYDLLAQYADSILNGIQLVQTHAPRGSLETEGTLISARVSTTDNAPVNDQRVIAAVIGDQAKIAAGITDADGKTQFILPFIYGETQVVFAASGNKSQRINIAMEEDSTQHTPIEFPCLTLTESMRANIEERVLNYRAQKGYYGGSLKKYLVPNVDTTDFYGRPDHFYALDNYVRFPDMKEILLEFVPELRVRNGATDQPVLQVLDEPFKSYFDSTALILLDGIPIQNTKALMAFNPLLIKSIDVMSRKYYLGDALFNGIVHYKTYKADLAGFSLPDEEVIYPLHGIQIPTTADFKKYDKADPMPNLRNLLYLANNQKINTTSDNGFQFFTSDADGAYKIVVRAKDKNGSAYYGEKIIHIE